MAEIAELATDLIGWINNHGKVQKMFVTAQEQIDVEQTAKPVVFAYLCSSCLFHRHLSPS